MFYLVCQRSHYQCFVPFVDSAFACQYCIALFESKEEEEEEEGGGGGEDKG